MVAISSDAPEVTRAHCQKWGFTYTFLSDPKLETILRYDLLHRAGGMDGNDIARPAEFLLDGKGVIRWVNLTSSVTVRARPDEVLHQIDEAKLGAAEAQDR